jgi:putative mRNA 3-end processing factor
MKELLNNKPISKIFNLPNIDKLSQNISTFNSGDEPLLTLKQITWQMTKIGEIQWVDQISAFITYLYKEKLINEVEFISLVKELYINRFLPDNFIFYLTTYLTDKVYSFSKFIAEIDYWRYTLVQPYPLLNEIISFYEQNYSKLKKNEKEYYENIYSKIHSLDKKPEEFYEHISQFSSNELIDLLDFIDFDNKSKITDEILTRLSESLDSDAYEGFEEQSKLLHEFWQQFPLSFTLLGEKMTVLPQKTLDMEQMEKIPQTKIQEWAPKFVYSRPEVPEKVTFYFPGGPNIGHSAILVKTNHGVVLLDFGMSVINNRMPKWHPLLEKVDAILISHAHLDHSGALPLLLRTDSKLANLPWFATKETNIICEMLFKDTMNVLRKTWPQEALNTNFVGRALTTEANIINALSNYNEIDLEKTISILPNFEVTPYSAGHLFGSVGFDIQIGNKNILYTGDFNQEPGALFSGAKFPNHDYNNVLFDGTNIIKKENQFTHPSLKNVTENSERVLIPAFSIGRTQEVLYQLLNQGIDKTHKIIVTGLGTRLTKKLNLKLNSKNILLAPGILNEEFESKTVVITGNGMLQGGTSRDLLEYTKNDNETTIVFSGYQSPNTMGYALYGQKNNWLTSNYKQKITKVSISGHTSKEGLENFLNNYSNNKTVVHAPKELDRKRVNTLGVKQPHDVQGKEF